MFSRVVNTPLEKTTKISFYRTDLQPRKFYIKRNNNKVDSIERSDKVTADLFP